MLQYLHSVTVPVVDQDRALAFYRDVLGAEVKADFESAPGRRWVAVGWPAGQTQIVLAPVTGESAQPAMQIGAFTGMVFYTDDLDATCAELTARGVTCITEPIPESWGGFEAHFADLDGNVFALVERLELP